MNLFFKERSIAMCKKCDGNCVYFPYVDRDYEYTINKKGLRHKVDSKKYNCVFLNKKIEMGKSCEKYTTHEDMKKYRKELVNI